MTSDRNPTDALNQALSEQRMAGAEKSSLEVIARALGIEEEVVSRVIYAYQHLRTLVWVGRGTVEEWEMIEDDQVRLAIRENMAAGARRVMLRSAIEKKTGLLIPTTALIPPEDAGKICNGCPERLECVAQSLYTPDQCYSGRLGRVSVVPLRMHKGKVDVETNQPLGRYTVPIEVFALKHY